MDRPLAYQFVMVGWCKFWSQLYDHLIISCASFVIIINAFIKQRSWQFENNPKQYGFSHLNLHLLHSGYCYWYDTMETNFDAKRLFL